MMPLWSDWNSGSPPLAREQHSQNGDGTKIFRITPARAGTTFGLDERTEVYEDHPRSRGNNLVSPCHVPQDWGSPPLAREQRFAIIFSSSVNRITPARAGTTLSHSLTFLAHWDHPRSRGTNLPSPCPRVRRAGSPPLAREQRALSEPFAAPRGITPARAGTTAKRSNKSRLFFYKPHPFYSLFSRTTAS